MNKTFFGFGIADSMFVGDCAIQRKVLGIEEVKALVEAGVEPCLNPSHQATIEAMQGKFGLMVEIPAVAPKVTLGIGDSVVIMGVRGLPRLENRHEYTDEEVEAASFSFSQYTVVG